MVDNQLLASRAHHLLFLALICGTVIDPFRQRWNRGIILNAVFNNSAQEAISTFSTQSG